MNELLWLILLLVNFATILLMFRIFGREGLAVWMALSVIAANIQVTKTVELFGVTATLGNIVYASSFLITDILSENYGKAIARRVVYYGLAVIIGFTLLMNLAVLFEPGPEDFAHESMAVIFGFLPRVALASVAAYLVSQLHDVWAYAFWKRRFDGIRRIWIRNNLSTMVSQLIDSVVFTTVAFAGVFRWPTFSEIVLTTYLLKVLVAAADTPFVYLATWWTRKEVVREG
ncbi:MAG: queuosine precursor transporter [Spirochaetaceae bacterium]